MSQDLYRFCFETELSTEEVEATFLLAIFAAEILYGEAHVRLEACHAFDSGQRLCVIDAATGIGRDLTRLFIGFMTKQFGPSSFSIERLDSQHKVLKRPPLATA